MMMLKVYRCQNCGYEARAVAQGESWSLRGALRFRTRSLSCPDCRNLSVVNEPAVDASPESVARFLEVTGSPAPSSTPEATPPAAPLVLHNPGTATYRCELCMSSNAVLWVEGDPCPRCGEPLEHVVGEIPAD